MKSIYKVGDLVRVVNETSRKVLGWDGEVKSVFRPSKRHKHKPTIYLVEVTEFGTPYSQSFPEDELEPRGPSETVED